jgi:hypothetical protein
MKMLKNIVPHVGIILSVVFIVFLILDEYNPTMNFVNNSISTGMLLVLCAVSLINAICLVVIGRREK